MMVRKRVMDRFGHLQLSRSVLVAANHRPFQQAAGPENIAHAGAAGVRDLLWNRFWRYFIKLLRVGASSDWRRLPALNVLLLQRDVHALHGLPLALLFNL
jgi:hypothetical protein